MDKVDELLKVEKNIEGNPYTWNIKQIVKDYDTAIKIIRELLCQIKNQ